MRVGKWRCRAVRFRRTWPESGPTRSWLSWQECRAARPGPCSIPTPEYWSTAVEWRRMSASRGGAGVFRHRKRAETVVPELVSFGVIHEDNDLIVIDKPTGIVVHPGAGQAAAPSSPACSSVTRSSKGWARSDRWGLVHRLDKETSGLLLVARNTESLRTPGRPISPRGRFIGATWLWCTAPWRWRPGQSTPRLAGIRCIPTRKRVTATAARPAPTTGAVGDCRRPEPSRVDARDWPNPSNPGTPRPRSSIPWSATAPIRPPTQCDPAAKNVSPRGQARPRPSQDARKPFVRVATPSRAGGLSRRLGSFPT